MLTTDQIDAIHDKIRERYPNGLSYEQFRDLTLATADDEGRVYPPPLAGLATFQMVLRMSVLEGLLDFRGTPHTSFIRNHFISQKGREAALSVGAAGDLP